MTILKDRDLTRLWIKGARVEMPRPIPTAKDILYLNITSVITVADITVTTIANGIK